MQISLFFCKYENLRAEKTVSFWFLVCLLKLCCHFYKNISAFFVKYTDVSLKICRRFT